MNDAITTQRWIGLYPGQCCQDGCIETEDGHAVMHGVAELSDYALQTYIIDLHNKSLEGKDKS